MRDGESWVFRGGRRVGSETDYIPGPPSLPQLRGAICLLGVPLGQDSCRESVLKVTLGGHTHPLAWAGKEAPTPLQNFKGPDGS